MRQILKVLNNTMKVKLQVFLNRSKSFKNKEALIEKRFMLTYNKMTCLEKALKLN